jgi:hypothetical protein
MLLNPQKFRSSMPSVFGPGDCQTILSSIFNSCINCAFQHTTVIQGMINTFSIPKDENKDSYIQIKCMNKTKTFLFFYKNFSSGKWFDSTCSST